MADEVTIKVRLQGAAAVAKDTALIATGIKKIGTESRSAATSAKIMGSAVSTATKSASWGLGLLATQARYGTLGIVGLAAAGTKWGLGFNAQVESARMRFRVFTDDVDGLTKAVQKIDLSSQFNFGDLAQQAALLGNFGVKARTIPSLLQGIANAAAASGQGTMGLQRIALDLGQIQSQGRVTGDELRDLAQAGAPVNDVLRKTFNLTDKQMQNVGAQGLDATKFLQAVTTEWNSGRMAGAAKRQLSTLGGQWQLFTGNAQKLAGAATHGLAIGLERDVLPAANRAVGMITEIFGRKGLSNEEKLRQAREVIRRELGPVWHDLSDALDHADIPGHLGDAIAAATPKVLNAGVHIGEQAAGAFVKGWLHAGPWAQFLTVAFLGNKLRKSPLGNVLTGLGGGKGGGKGGGGLGGVVGKGSPVPVWVTNPGFGGPGVPGAPGGGKGGWGSKVRTALRATPMLAARAAPPLAGGVAIAEGLNAFLPGSVQAAINQNHPYGAGGAAVRRQAAAEMPPGMAGPMRRVTEVINLNVDGKTMSRATRVYDAIEQGRLAASAAARR